MKALSVTLALLFTVAALSPAVADPGDFVAFKGLYKKAGHNLVATGTSKFRGTSTKIKINTGVTGLPAKVTIVASVKSRGSSIPVNNGFKFTGANRFQGDNLAPGVTGKVPFKGHFTALPGQISFQGKFSAGAKGTFKGTIVQTADQITIEYEIVIGENTAPSYIYKYVAKR